MSEELKEFRDIITVFEELLLSDKFSGFVSKHTDSQSKYAELKTIATTLKEIEEVDEDITRNFIHDFVALVSKVFPADTEENIKEKKIYIEGGATAELKLDNLLNKSGGYGSNLTLSEFRKVTVESGASRMRSYTIVTIFVLILIGIVFLSGKLQRDIYPFLVFIFLMSVPLIVIFRRHIYEILPLKVSELEDLTEGEKAATTQSNSQFTKDLLSTGSIGLLNMFAILMLVTKGKTFMGIMLASISAIAAGSMVFGI